MVPNDNVMLLSYINMKLRDYYQNFDALCEDLQLDALQIIERLGTEGYYYDEVLNRFAPL